MSSGAAVLRYHEQLAHDPETAISDAPKAKVHRAEFAKVLAGDPVEINPSTGSGYRVFSVDEWSARFKTSSEFPECLACGSANTKEHAFTQTWCRGKRMWEAESLCLDCLKFSWRAYRDPDFQTPAEHEKEHWAGLVARMAAM